jgi:hypothetical protein
MGRQSLTGTEQRFTCSRSRVPQVVTWRQDVLVNLSPSMSQPPITVRKVGQSQETG